MGSIPNIAENVGLPEEVVEAVLGGDEREVMGAYTTCSAGGWGHDAE